jgi:hypothetical protein
LKSSISGPFFYLGLALLTAALAWRLIFFGISLNALPASADEANGVLAAKNMARGDFPLLITGSPYQFPIESYLLNPLVQVLPRNAFGARYVAVLTGFISLGGFLLIFLFWPSFRRAWPGFLLLLFPSAYWLIWQAAYIPTNYNPALMLAVFGLLLTLLARNKPPYPARLFFLAGLLLGLAFCAIMLTLPLLLMTGLYIFFSQDWKKGLRGLIPFCLGLTVGLMPFYLAGWFIPGANQAVAGSYPWPEALKRAWPLISQNLPIVMGITPCLYPDFKTTLSLIPGLALPFTIFYLLILGIVTLLRGGHHFTEFWRKKWFFLKSIDVFLGISWLGLLFFILSRRSHQHTYRYLLPLAWSFPFLIGYLYVISSRRVRTVLGTGVILLIFFNLTIGVALMRIWSKPGFASTQADMPDIQPALICLDHLRINRAYASMWVASRIAYETDERILCTQPYNTRFEGWPILYKKEVDSSGQAAYVLTHSDRFTAQRFEDDLKAMAVTSRRDACGEFLIYTDFTTDREPPGRRVSLDQLTIRASYNNASTGILKDGRKMERWGSHHPQEKGMWIEISLPSPRFLSAVGLWYNRYAHDMAPFLRILARKGNGWTPLVTSGAAELDRFAFQNNHPVYGDKMQTIPFPVTQTDALRLEIIDPNSQRDWSLVEIELYERIKDTGTPGFKQLNLHSLSQRRQ